MAETLRLAKAYVAEGQAVDQLVAEVDGATARADGPSPEHPWERALRELQRAHQQVHELEPPLPRWHGLQQREQQDNAIRFDKLRRKKKLTDTEQHELQRLGQERAATPPVSSSDGRRRARA